MLFAFIASVALVVIYVWQDGLRTCNDGRRYVSGVPQPYPFHRRWCSWPKQMLIVMSLTSMVVMGTAMGDWKKALLLLTLPGACFLVTHPTTVDGPAILLAWGASLLFPTHPWFAVLMSCVAGFVHERAPVYAALYAWHPLLLVGLVAVGWWRTPAPPDDDIRVGRGFIYSFLTHKGDHDWLSLQQTLTSSRALPVMAGFYGVSTAAWLALGLAWGQRLICSDLGRLVFWAGPIIVRDLPDVPTWLVLVQVMTFRRMG